MVPVFNVFNGLHTVTGQDRTRTGQIFLFFYMGASNRTELPPSIEGVICPVLACYGNDPPPPKCEFA